MPRRLKDTKIHKGIFNNEIILVFPLCFSALVADKKSISEVTHVFEFIRKLKIVYYD